MNSCVAGRKKRQYFLEVEELPLILIDVFKHLSSVILVKEKSDKKLLFPFKAVFKCCPSTPQKKS